MVRDAVENKKREGLIIAGIMFLGIIAISLAILAFKSLNRPSEQLDSYETKPNTLVESQSENQIKEKKIIREISPTFVTDIPEKVMESIKSEIVGRYPDNNSMQETLIESQITKYRALIR